MLDAVLLGLFGVILDLCQPQVVNECRKDCVGSILSGIEAHDFEVVMLREGKEVTTPLTLLRADNAIALHAAEALSQGADYRVMACPKKITALKAWFVGPS